MRYVSGTPQLRALVTVQNEHPTRMLPQLLCSPQVFRSRQAGVTSIDLKVGKPASWCEDKVLIALFNFI